MQVYGLRTIPRYLAERRDKGVAVFVPDVIRKCVAFVGIKRDDGTFIPTATGFFAHAGETSHLYSYFVTAEHVIASTRDRITRDEKEKGIKGQLAARLNIKNGGSETLSLEKCHWWSHPDLRNLSDVSVTPWPYQHDYFDHFPLPFHGAVIGACTTSHLRGRGAGLGQEIAIIGLFRHHIGTERNEPLVRVGSIAAMPEEKVWTDYCGYMDGYLVEAHSIGGLSGSPVFVNLTYSGPITMHVGGVNRYESREGEIDFSIYMPMGLMHGHWDLPNLIDAANEDAKSTKERINTGVGVVIPIQKIIETLYQPELIDMRKKLEDKERRESGATPDLADDDAPPASDANPTHREDFNSLLGAAARKREPKAGT